MRILFALLCGACAQAEVRPDAPLQRPNLIVIMVDDLGPEGLASYGGLDCRTPNLDRLAAGGMSFTHCYSNPLCTPTRVQLLSGRYNHRNYQGFGYFDPQELSFAQLLRKAGYRTAITGKWQLSGNAKTVRSLGFERHCLWNMHDYVGDHRDGAAGEPESWLRRYWGPTLYRDGRWFEYGQNTYGPDVCCDFAADFIGRPSERPFLLYYPMMLVHDPFQPTPHCADRNSKDRAANAIAMVEYMDHLVGDLLQRLRELDLERDTLILFTTDNGSHRDLSFNTERGPVQGGKASMTDAGTHVPLIASWPGVIEAGSVRDDLVDFTDFLPTLLDAAGVVTPKDEALDGHSILPLLTGNGTGSREWIYCSYWKRGRNAEAIRRSARDRRWKLYDDGSLYDLHTDPLEERAIPIGQSAASEQARSKLGAVLAKMESGTVTR